VIRVPPAPRHVVSSDALLLSISQLASPTHHRYGIQPHGRCGPCVKRSQEVTTCLKMLIR
jgi:hypothetical protein